MWRHKNGNLMSQEWVKVNLIWSQPLKTAVAKILKTTLEKSFVLPPKTHEKKNKKFQFKLKKSGKTEKEYTIKKSTKPSLKENQCL